MLHLPELHFSTLGWLAVLGGAMGIGMNKGGLTGLGETYADDHHLAALRAAADAFGVLALISLSLGIINLFPFLPLDGGHIFYVLSFPTPAKTWVYDLSIKAWHERGYWTRGKYDRYRGRVYAHAFCMDFGD